MKLITPILIFGIIILNSSNAQTNAFVDYLNNHGSSPEQYIATKFDSYDIIVLGETHQKKEYCELVSQAIIESHERTGLDYFAFEFIKSIHNQEANALVNAVDWSEENAIALFRKSAWPTWGFREYIDIFKTIWQINKSAPDSEKIAIIALDSDWDQARNMCSEKRSRQEAFQHNLDREKNMFDQIDKAYTPGTKILVHIGFAHAIYKLKPRTSSELYAKYPDKLFTICLHHNFPGMPDGKPVNGVIEEIFLRLDNVPLGFDIINTPFGPMKDKSSHYFRFPGHDHLSDITMGYIFLKPVDSLSSATWVPGFIDENQFEAASCVARKMKWAEGADLESAEALDAALRKRFNGK